MNIVTLKAAITINLQMTKMSPQEIENYIRQNLARQLADAIINEDLIQIYTNKDLSTNTLTARTLFKVVQE